MTKLVIILKNKEKMTDEIFKCDHCGDRFLKFTIDPNDALDFDGTLCKGCIYKLLFECYRKKVWKIEDFIEDW